MDLIAFNILAVIVTVAALGVIVSRNPVHSVLFLILAFFTSAGLLVLIGAEFLAMLLVVVYVGAVAVLFLFVVMMLDVDFAELKQGTLGYWPVGLLAGGILLGELALIGFARGGDAPGRFDSAPGADTNAEAIGAVIYTDYILLFQIAGIGGGGNLIKFKEPSAVWRVAIDIVVTRTSVDAVCTVSAVDVAIPSTRSDAIIATLRHDDIVVG